MLSREFTKKEKILLLACLVLALGVIYYQVVYKGIRSQMANYSTDELEAEIEIEQTKAAQIAQMQAVIDANKDRDAGMLMPYNNLANEINLVGDITKGKAEGVSVSWSTPVLNGTTIRILSALNQANCPIYMMFGTESLGTQSPEQTITHFTTLLDSLIATAPESQVIVMSIPPVTAEAEKAADHPLLNSVIDDYNSRLLALCDKKNVYFVDINTALKNNDGKLDGHLATEDGMHLSLEGGMVLLNYVLSHVPQD